MYKKITHTIVEEHFDHPIAGEIKKSISRSRIPNNEILSENKFRSDVSAYFASYMTKLNTMMNSVTGTEENLIVPFEELFKDCQIDTLGNLTKPIYSSEFGERINAAFRNIAISVLILVPLIKSGKDYSLVTNRFAFIFNDMAFTLSNFNNNWNFQQIQILFQNIMNEILNQVKARNKKDNIAEQAASQKITDYLSAFEQTLVDGIINQHPERFTRATTSSFVTPKTSYTNNDIM